MAGPITQDWEPVVIRKKAPTAAARKDEKAVNAARRAGAEIETIKKCSFLSLSVPNFFPSIRVSDYFAPFLNRFVLDLFFTLNA